MEEPFSSTHHANVHVTKGVDVYQDFSKLVPQSTAVFGKEFEMLGGQNAGVNDAKIGNSAQNVMLSEPKTDLMQPRAAEG